MPDSAIPKIKPPITRSKFEWFKPRFSLNQRDAFDKRLDHWPNPGLKIINYVDAYGSRGNFLPIFPVYTFMFSFSLYRYMIYKSCDSDMTVHISGKDCLMTSTGWDYNGMWDTTVSGRKCQRWKLNQVCPCVHVKENYKI